MRVGWGAQGIVDVATLPEVDVVLGGVVGAAGLPPAYEAVKLGKTLALANKEVLVVAGEAVMAAAARLRRGGPPRRLGALRAPPGAPRRAPLRGRAARPDGLRRPVPDAAPRDVRRDHDRGRPRPPDLEDGAEDHDRLGDDDEQGARGHRGALALRRPARAARRRHPPPVDHPLDGRVGGRIGPRADVAERHALPDPLRPDVPRARPDAPPEARPRLPREARARAARREALPGGSARLRGAPGRRDGPRRPERGQRGRRRRVPRGTDPLPLSRFRRGEGPRGAPAFAGDVPRRRPRRRSRGAPPGRRARLLPARRLHSREPSRRLRRS